MVTTFEHGIGLFTGQRTDLSPNQSAVRTGAPRSTEGTVMQRNCWWCGAAFSAPTKRARYCSGAHRAAASKARANGAGVLPRRVGPLVGHSGAARAAMEGVLRENGIGADNWLHPVAVAAAEAFDDPETPTSALAGVAGAVQTVLRMIDDERVRIEFGAAES